VVITFLPTLITRQILYGYPFELGYGKLGAWAWKAPVLGKVLFSSEHGLLTWTPILIPALVGLRWFWRRDAELAGYFVVCFLAFYYLIASYPNWAGISSFGNRFFVSLTPVFVVGLTASLSAVAEAWQEWASAAAARIVVVLLIVWNFAFIFQWGTYLVPARGPISWRAMAYNQVAVVPGKLVKTMKSYFFARGALMQHIEQKDVEQLQHKEAQHR